MVNLADVARGRAPGLSSTRRTRRWWWPMGGSSRWRSRTFSTTRFATAAGPPPRMFVSRDEGASAWPCATKAPGLDEAARSRKMFERYWRAADDGAGSGLGLALVRAVAGRGARRRPPDPAGRGLEESRCRSDASSAGTTTHRRHRRPAVTAISSTVKLPLPAWARHSRHARRGRRQLFASGPSPASSVRRRAHLQRTCNRLVRRDARARPSGDAISPWPGRGRGSRAPRSTSPGSTRTRRSSRGPRAGRAGVAGRVRPSRRPRATRRRRPRERSGARHRARRHRARVERRPRRRGARLRQPVDRAGDRRRARRGGRPHAASVDAVRARVEVGATPEVDGLRARRTSARRRGRGGAARLVHRGRDLAQWIGARGQAAAIRRRRPGDDGDDRSPVGVLVEWWNVARWRWSGRERESVMMMMSRSAWWSWWTVE